MAIESSNTTAAINPLKSSSSQIPYLPGLDGLRALAVIAVLFYHADLDWIPGGFLGVEIFFVISGYLITSLLLTEWLQQGYVNLRSFWLRRARRLLPALFLMIAMTLVFALVVLPREVAELRGDVMAAIGYVTNWYLIFNDKSYFEITGRPSMLQHLWSLAVEEQFYIIFPLLFALGMRLWRRKGMFLAVLIGIILSSGYMASLFQPDTDPSRLYYGTDTRAAGLLIGVALALVWRPGQLPNRWRRIYTFLLDATGIAALGLLVWFCLEINEYEQILYQGGFAIVSTVTAMLIAITVHPQSRLGFRLLAWQPLRWIGIRSYGIYLWHWPIFMITRPQLDLPLDGAPLMILRLALTLILTELSYRFIETPIRRGAIEKAWRSLRESQGMRQRRLGVRWVGGITAILVFSLGLGVSMADAQHPASPPYLSANDSHPIEVRNTHQSAIVKGPQAPSPTAKTGLPTSALPPTPETSHDSGAVAATVTPVGLPGGLSGGSPSNSVTSPDIGLALAVTPAPPAIRGTAGEPRQASAEDLPDKVRPIPTAPPQKSEAPPARKVAPTAAHVTAIGDSVMLGAVKEMGKAIEGIDIDAVTGRQAADVLSILRTRQKANQLGSIVIIHTGNNGTFSTRQFTEMMDILAGVPKVVVITVKVPRRWESLNNTVLADEVQQYPQVLLADWHEISADHPEFFWNDGIHLKPAGAEAFASMLQKLVLAPVPKIGNK
ncbi:MAG: acyltransferase family protein [Chloroflexi bacterium]|nr:acyltransferase family protein [Chloroflexota bacterium]